MQGQLALKKELISALHTDQILKKQKIYSFFVTGCEFKSKMVLCWKGQVTNLLLLVQHDMRLEAGDAGESFSANGACEVRGCVRGPVQCEVELHVECLRALVTSMRLQEREEKFNERKGMLRM